MNDYSKMKAIAFDAYGTLFDVHSVIQACDAMFPGYGESLSNIWRTKQLEYSWLMSLMGKYEDFWHVTERALSYAANVLGLESTREQRELLIQGYLSLKTYPEAKKALQALSSKRLIILSNGAPDMLKAVVKNAELDGVFEVIISADEAKIFKPSVRVYQLAPDRLGIMASEIGFVSSNSWDVIGAKSFGFITCWVNRQNTPLDELGVTPDIVVDSLDSLAKVLSRV